MPYSLPGIWGRPLGNVVYFMVSPLTNKAVCDGLLDALIAEIEADEAGRRKGEEGGGGISAAAAGAVAATGSGEQGPVKERSQPVP